MKNRKYDWNEIQKFYDEGHTWREITEKFGIKGASLGKAYKRGDFISTRNPSDAAKLKFEKGFKRKHSEETKKKISESRTKYLLEHPEKVPYRLNHSSKKSWPEEVFENALKSFGIVGWVSEYQNSIYQYDFAFPELKIDIEVDGGTHKTEKVQKIDKKRDEFSLTNGWKIVRFDAERVKKDVVSCINELKLLLVI